MISMVCHVNIVVFIYRYTSWVPDLSIIFPAYAELVQKFPISVKYLKNVLKINLILSEGCNLGLNNDLYFYGCLGGAFSLGGVFPLEAYYIFRF